MRVTFLGTGTLEPQAHRASTSLWFEASEDALWIDCGRNALSRAVECGFDPLRAPELLLTHLHPDHCCELVSLLFARNYHRDPAGPPASLATLRITGPPGTAELVERMGEAWRWVRPRRPLEVEEIGGGWSGERAGFEVQAVAVPHGNVAALGYRIARAGAAVGFTGDTGPGTELEALATGVDLLIAECGRRDGDEGRWHLDAGLAAALAQQSGSRNLALTHFYPEVDRAMALERARAIFAGSTVLAEDGMVLDVRPDGVNPMG